jgi:predicted acyltransferase
VNAVSSAATIVCGVLVGELLRGKLSSSRKLLVLCAAGAAGLALGYAASPWVPLVKKIWTASFGVFALGWTLLLMAAFYAVIDGLHWRRWAFPFVVVGLNSIAIYVLASTLRPAVGSALKPFVQQPLAAWPTAGPVVHAVLVVLVFWLCCFWLYRHRIFFKL